MIDPDDYMIYMNTGTFNFILIMVPSVVAIGITLLRKRTK